VVGFLLAGASAAHATMPPIFDWFDKEIWRRIDITGRRSLGYHRHAVTGDRDAFESYNYYGEGGKTFTDTGQVTLVGNKVLGIFNFNMTLTDNRYNDPQSKRIWLSYAKSGFELGYGDLTSVSLLNTNDFARYTKTLSGATAGYKKGRFAIKALRTEAKSSARTRSIQGSNSVGPYYIGDSQIVNDSEEVKVDGIDMKQGLDYTINYQIGTINFVSKMIAPTSTIVVSYETLGFNHSSGTVQGAGMSYDMGQYGRVGFTAIEQKTGGGTGLNSTTQLFQGQGSPDSPYLLDFEPLTTRPIIVKVNGVIQVPNVDYIFGQDSKGNPIYALIYMTRAIPSTLEVQITYTPKPVQTIDGDRRVIGVDYRLPLGKKGFLQYSQATGELSNGINPLKGTARGVKGEYSFGDFKLRGNLRNVPDDFVTVESRSFNRNEKALDLGLDYKKKNYTWGLSSTTSEITYRTVSSNNEMVVNESKYANQRAYVTFTPPTSKGITWSLEHNRSQSNYASNDTRLDSTTLSMSKSFGHLNTRLALERQSGVGPVIDGTSVSQESLELNAIRLIADYTTSSGWFFGTRTSLSSTKLGSESGKGNDITLSTSYKPGSGPFDFDASYTMSDSGSLSTAGSFNNGTGIGYNGSGFSSSASSSSYISGASDYRLLTFNPNYRLSSKLSLNGRYYQSSSSGGYNSNSETNAFGLGFTWDLGGNTLLTSSVDRTSTKFYGATARSEATSLDFGLMGNPRGPWSYRLGLTSLISGQQTTYSQDSYGVDGFLRFKINPRSNASFQFNVGRTSGYLPQSESFVGMFYEYQLYRNVALVGSYKMRRVLNNDSSLSGAYRSNGFDLELNFNFGG